MPRPRLLAKAERIRAWALAHPTVVQLSDMEPKKHLARSTIEAYVGIIGGLGLPSLAAMGYQIKFWWGLVLVGVVLFCLVDLIWNSKPMIGRARWIKGVCSVLVCVFSLPLIIKGWSNTHPKTSLQLATQPPACNSPTLVMNGGEITNNGTGIRNNDPEACFELDGTKANGNGTFLDNTPQDKRQKKPTIPPISSQPNSRPNLENVIIDGFGSTGLRTEGPIKIKGGAVRNEKVGIVNNGQLKLDQTEVSGNGTGIVDNPKTKPHPEP
jgi:hypothetical protein